MAKLPKGAFKDVEDYSFEDETPIRTQEATQAQALATAQAADGATRAPATE